MALREVLKFQFRCDGYKPNGQPCPCDLTTEAFSRTAVEKYAREVGWYEDHRGWICNAGGGHRDDRDT